MCQLLNTTHLQWWSFYKGLRLSKWSWRSTQRLLNQGTSQVFRHIRLAPSEHLAAAGSPGHRHRHLWGDWPDHFPSPHVLKVEPPTIPTSSTPGSQADLLISSTRRGDGMSAGSPKRPAMPARLVPLQTEVLQVGWSFGVYIWHHTQLSVSESLLEKSHVLPLKWPFFGSYDVQFFFHFQTSQICLVEFYPYQSISIDCITHHSSFSAQGHVASAGDLIGLPSWDTPKLWQWDPPSPMTYQFYGWKIFRTNRQNMGGLLLLTVVGIFLGI